MVSTQSISYLGRKSGGHQFSGDVINSNRSIENGPKVRLVRQQQLREELQQLQQLDGLFHGFFRVDESRIGLTDVVENGLEKAGDGPQFVLDDRLGG